MICDSEYLTYCQNTIGIEMNLPQRNVNSKINGKEFKPLIPGNSLQSLKAHSEAAVDG